VPVESGTARRLPELEAVADTLVEIKDMHQKILVIDERLCFLGSLNTLSHAPGGRGRREIMVAPVNISPSL
jgi:hypothetical protein